jgi:hypothetical protein
MIVQLNTPGAGTNRAARDANRCRARPSRDFGIWAAMMLPEAEHFREIVDKLREAAATCQFAGDPKGGTSSRGTF